MKKQVIYTAIFGEYDKLYEPKVIESEFDYICFTDNKNLKSKKWEIRHVENKGLDFDLMNRKYKLLPHLFLKGYELSVYIDGNIKIINSIGDLLNNYLDDQTDFLAPIHPERDCIYSEVKKCFEINKISEKVMCSIISDLENDFMPMNFGLTENNILIRRHNKSEIINLDEEWWKMFNYSRRDQLSLTYLFWKKNIKFKVIQENSRGNSRVFFAYPHKNYDSFSKFKIYLKYILLFNFKLNFVTVRKYNVRK